jgi:TolA-binding protein
MKKFFVLMLGLSLFSPALYADEKSEPGFWEMLRMKIEQLTPQKKLSTTTAVGGVRGAPVEGNDLYWKGEAKPAATIDSDELAAFQNAMSLVDTGKKSEAQTAFSDFTKKYPDSPLRKDADQALGQLQSK